MTSRTGNIPPPPPGWTIVPPEGSNARRRRWVGPVVGALVLGLAGAGGVVGYQALTPPAGSAAATQAEYPDAWAPEIQPYADFVERERGLDFLHPVHVDFLSAAEFRKEVTAEDGEVTADDRKELRQLVGIFRALGFVQGKLDLLESQNTLNGEGIVGFYSPKTKRIAMRGAKLSLPSRDTLVHELTHALQDQHYDIGTRREQMEKAENATAQAIFTALIEGDASRVATAYREQELTPREKARIARTSDAQLKRFGKATKEVPRILTTLMGFPYAVGEVLLSLAVELDGHASVEALFTTPPTTEEHLLDPWTFFREAQTGQPVGKPPVRRGEKEFDSGDFGITTWYLMLAERLPLADALEAADGWGGDRYVAFERRGRSCLRIDYRGDTPQDTAQMRDALERWGAAHGPASVKPAGRGLRFESCDPGRAGTAGAGRSDKALGFAIVRNQVLRGMLHNGVPESPARCYAQEVVRRFTFEELTAPKPDPALVQRFQQTMADCR